MPDPRSQIAEHPLHARFPAPRLDQHGGGRIDPHQPPVMPRGPGPGEQPSGAAADVEDGGGAPHETDVEVVARAPGVEGVVQRGEREIRERAIDHRGSVPHPTERRDRIRPPRPWRERELLHHVELWVPDLERAVTSWGWLFERLGWEPYQDWPHGPQLAHGGDVRRPGTVPGADGRPPRPAAPRPEPPRVPRTGSRDARRAGDVGPRPRLDPALPRPAPVRRMGRDTTRRIWRTRTGSRWSWSPRTLAKRFDTVVPGGHDPTR